MQEDPNKITYFAKTNSRGKETPFGIKRRDRARHMYVIGKTGMGKSTLLENMAIQDIRNGEGMAFIDPHGSTVDRLLEYVPEHRIKDVIYFAPFDMEHPIAFNVMEDVGYDKRHLVVSGLITAFKKLWVDAFSARMEYILSNTLLALLEYPDATMLDVNRMLVEKNFRKKVVDNIKDPIVSKFWTEEFANYTDRYTQEATPAIQNKVGQFTSNPLIRNIIGQAKSSFDIREAMDNKKILIINLSKGRVGEVNASLLGSMLVTKIYLAAMSRADAPAAVMATLPNFYFYVDEFQNFANESFADILSEARKYKLNLLIAHQYVEQMEEEVRDAVFGNVGTTVAFRVGPFDAEVLETVFEPQFAATDLVNLGFAQVYLTLMIDGVGSPPFSATTLEPFGTAPQSYVQKVLASSRAQFSSPRAEVEATIAQWQSAELTNSQQEKQKKESYSRDKAQPRSESKEKEEKGQPPVPAVPQPASRTEPEIHRESSRSAVQQVVEKRETRVHEPVTVINNITIQPKIPAVVVEAPRPRPKVVEEKPPLEGATSLRDALAQIAAKNHTPTPAAPMGKESPQQHHTQPLSEKKHTPPVLDLKETLGKILSGAQKTLSQEIHQPTVPISPPEKVEQPVGLPEEVMRDMLAVDDYSEQNR